MSLATTIAQYRERANTLWLARTDQERSSEYADRG